MTVESEPGHGARFRILFPLALDEADRASDGAAETGLPATETILLVEDDEMLRTFLLTVLRSSGYEVVAAPDGSTALQLARAHAAAIDLLLTDVVLPGRTGRELAEEFRKLHPSCPVLFMSGYTADEVLLREVEERGLTFLPKPFSPATLTARVREILDAAPN